MMQSPYITNTEITAAEVESVKAMSSVARECRNDFCQGENLALAFVGQSDTSEPTYKFRGTADSGDSVIVDFSEIKSFSVRNVPHHPTQAQIRVTRFPTISPESLLVWNPDYASLKRCSEHVTFKVDCDDSAGRQLCLLDEAPYLDYQRAYRIESLTTLGEIQLGYGTFFLDPEEAAVPSVWWAIPNVIADNTYDLENQAFQKGISYDSEEPDSPAPEIMEPYSSFWPFPRCRVLLPGDYDATKRYPLILALRGPGNQGRRSLEFLEQTGVPGATVVVTLLAPRMEIQASVPAGPICRSGTLQRPLGARPQFKAVAAWRSSSAFTTNLIAAMTRQLELLFKTSSVFLLGVGDASIRVYEAGIANPTMYGGLICLGSGLDSAVIRAPGTEGPRDSSLSVNHLAHPAIEAQGRGGPSEFPSRAYELPDSVSQASGHNGSRRLPVLIGGGSPSDSAKLRELLTSSGCDVTTLDLDSEKAQEADVLRQVTLWVKSMAIQNR
jgi:hypothetical protein